MVGDLNGSQAREGWRTRLFWDPTFGKQNSPSTEEAPDKTSLWSKKRARRLPKLLVVLEEWISPTWTHIYSNERDGNPGPFAVGLATSSESACPQWSFVAIRDETLSAPSRIGNTGVSSLYF
jgi:hypothetical protein